MSSTTAQMPPPFRVRRRRLIPPTEALRHLSEYLAAANEDAHLHPDAIFAADHAQFSTQGSVGGVILHNLRRLEAGLNGEVLVPEPDIDTNTALANDAESRPQYAITTPVEVEQDSNNSANDVELDSSQCAVVNDRHNGPQQDSDILGVEVAVEREVGGMAGDWQDSEGHGNQRAGSEIGMRHTGATENGRIPPIEPTKQSTTSISNPTIQAGAQDGINKPKKKADKRSAKEERRKRKDEKRKDGSKRVKKGNPS